MRDKHVQVSVDAAASLSLVFIWGVEGTGVTSSHLENAQIFTNLSVWRGTNGPEAGLTYSFWLRHSPASTRVAVGGFLFCLGSTEYEKAQGVGESRCSYGI